MPLLDRVPQVSVCCGCVTDLKTAVAIIAVMGIVTSPALSWAVVRHAYVIRVSCFVTSSATRPDVVDVNLNNVLSFGFGANAGLGPSCLAKNSTKSDLRGSEENKSIEPWLTTVVKYFGWIVLFVDLIFLVTSINFLVNVFKGSDKVASTKFIITALVSIFLSFCYGMLFVATCIFVGGSFPIFEFFFALFDLIIWITWLNFKCVLRSYYQERPRPVTCFWRYYNYIYDYLRYIIRSMIFGTKVVTKRRRRILG